MINDPRKTILVYVIRKMIAVKEQEPVVIGGVISTLYKVKADLELLGNELAGHKEEWCAIQVYSLWIDFISISGLS